MTPRSKSALAGATVLLDRSIREQLKLAWRLLRDERVSSIKYVLPTLLALYVLSPLDPIPDFLLGIGQMDDLGVIIGGMLLLARVIPTLAPPHVVDEHVRHMQSGEQQEERRKTVDDTVVDARFNVHD